MTSVETTQEIVLEHAMQSIAVGSKSFAAASRLFAPATRRSAVMLYAWCRHCDDVIDGQEAGQSGRAFSQEDINRRLEDLIAATRAVYAGLPIKTPAFAAFKEVVNRHGIAEAYALEHLSGFAMDAHERRYQCIDDTLDYCYHVAGVVGLMMAQVMGVRSEETLDRACDLGMAFQLTNIVATSLKMLMLAVVTCPLNGLMNLQYPQQISQTLNIDNALPFWLPDWLTWLNHIISAQRPD